jgi:sulfur relay (sulfurtransferase) DsrF/TusC family protein
MAKRILQILTTGYRATLEEQDDQVLWLVHMLHNSGADTDVLLRGGATNYVVRNQDASGLALGEWRQTQPPDLAGEVTALIRKGVRAFVVMDELKARGIRRNETLADVAFVAKSELAALLRGYDQVWQW